MQKIIKNKKGFTALVAVVILSTGLMTLALVVMSNSVSYSDMVIKRENRIRRSLQLQSCLNSLKIMALKDNFLIGSMVINEFQCRGYIEKDLFGEKIFRVESLVI